MLTAAGAFVVVRNLHDGAQARAAPEDAQGSPDDKVCGKTFGPGGEVVDSYCLPVALEPWWYVPFLEQERLKPRADVVLNGIHVGPNSKQPGGPCFKPDPSAAIDYSEYRDVTPSEVAGTDLEIVARYLPPKTDLVEEYGRRCGPGVAGLAIYTKGFNVRADPNVMRFGGVLIISRVRGEHYADSQMPLERLKPGFVMGRPAVIGEPLTEPRTKSGFGPSEVIIAEPFGVTIVRADGIGLDELLRIAEGLYR